MKNKLNIFLLLLLLVCGSCSKDGLQETVYSSLGENNYFQNADDAEALLTAAYIPEQMRPFRNYFVMAEIPTGTVYDRSGGLEALAKPFETFSWDATHSFFSTIWANHYSTIYRANLILDKVPGIDFDTTRKKVILAEARFLRASAYVILHDLFGAVPIIESSKTSATDRPSRPSSTEFDAFVTGELEAVGPLLEVSPQKGRASKGAAYAQLAKYYLNVKNWERAAYYAKVVMDLSVYALFDGSTDRSELFNPVNENNKEFIYIRPRNAASGLGDNYISHAAPPGYRWSGSVKDNYATQFKTYKNFYDLYSDNDSRKKAFITQYYNTNGVLVLLANDDIRNFKFKEDLTATGGNSGNDFPVIRYADILLTRAEALNELNGPNAESVALLNQIREKAGISVFQLSDFTSKDALKTAIFNERNLEFVAEELHRQDQIRQGVFIQQAKTRGIPANDYQVLYPIPQTEIDKNPNLIQNEGYAK